MKIPDYDREDPGDLEELTSFFASVAEKTGAQSSPDLQPLIERMTEQLEHVSQALSRKLSDRDNFNSEIKTVALEQDVPKTISARGVTGPVTSVVVRRVFPRGTFLSPPALGWRTLASGDVEVVVHWVTDPGEPVNVELLLRGD